jgi:hypothetical protein
MGIMGEETLVRLEKMVETTILMETGEETLVRGGNYGPYGGGNLMETMEEETLVRPAIKAICEESHVDIESDNSIIDQLHCKIEPIICTILRGEMEHKKKTGNLGGANFGNNLQQNQPQQNAQNNAPRNYPNMTIPQLEQSNGSHGSGSGKELFIIEKFCFSEK